MASSRLTSNAPEFGDVAVMWKAFEEQNHCTIEVTVNLVETQGVPDLRLSAKAWPLEVDKRGAQPLALSSVSCRADRHKALGGAFFYLLYRLDFAIAESAWQDALDVRAKPPRT